MTFKENSIIYLDYIDSTNNYAMQMVNDDKAFNGLTIVADKQTNGKGQRGKTWVAAAGDSLLMSLVVLPTHIISEQFLFNALITYSIAKVLKGLDSSYTLAIKWPNDIIINDKKAGGILIENVLKGTKWTHAIIGFGLNILQESFPPELPYATSLKIASGKKMEKKIILEKIRIEIMYNLSQTIEKNTILSLYNMLLYKKNLKQTFKNENIQWEAKILNVSEDGTLQVCLGSNEIMHYQHGRVIWVYS